MTGGKKGRASSWGALSLFLAGILSIAGLLYGLSPGHFLEVRITGEGRLFLKQVVPGDVFSYCYLHSVERTSVCERYRIDNNFRMILSATHYSSLGAGLPYGAAGRFAAENGTFVLDGLDRVVEVLRIKPTAFTPCGISFEDQYLALDRPGLNGRSLEVRVVRTSRIAYWRWMYADGP